MMGDLLIYLRFGGEFSWCVRVWYLAGGREQEAEAGLQAM